MVDKAPAVFHTGELMSAVPTELSKELAMKTTSRAVGVYWSGAAWYRIPLQQAAIKPVPFYTLKNSCLTLLPYLLI